MYELTINGKVYQFNFGIGFARELDKSIQADMEGVKGVKQNIGLTFYIASIIDHNPVALLEVLNVANKGQSPRITMSELEAFIDSEECDIEKICEDVEGFFERGNATKGTITKLKQALKDKGIKVQ